MKNYVAAEVLARQIKDGIYTTQRLTCSVGVGPNKLIAKIASDFQKPNGLTVVKQEDVREFLAPLPVRRLLWVGCKAGQKLESMGVKTVGDLGLCDPSLLVDMFGELGVQLHLMAQGIDKSDVQEKDQIISISRELTFEKDEDDFEAVLLTLDKLAELVCEDALKQHFQFKTVTVKVRYENFETHTRSKTLLFITSQHSDAKKTAKELLKPYLDPGRSIRLIGLRVSNLISGSGQRTLLNDVK